VPCCEISKKFGAFCSGYQTYSVPDRLGLHWRYDCIRSALKPQGYEVERIIIKEVWRILLGDDALNLIALRLQGAAYAVIAPVQLL
jgi:hypothetical protein